MAGEHTGVELERLEQPERFYDREALLGRDTSSVFPSTSKSALTEFATAAGLNAPRFVTETELEQIKALRGGSVEDGTVSVDKPLHEVLRENKEKKEAEFQDKWRLMKQGQNKPLEDDEVAFLDTVTQQEHEQEKSKRAELAREVESFQLMREQMLVKKVTEPAPSRSAPPSVQQKVPQAAPKPKFTTIVKPRASDAEEQQAKRQRASTPPSSVLLGLAAYGSDEDEQ